MRRDIRRTLLAMRLLSVTGTRPQFVKAAPLHAELAKHVDLVVADTGQHYDHELSRVFNEELGLGEPDVRLGVGSGSHAEQTAAMLVGIERAALDARPDAMLVYGDTNSTLAGALVAAKLNLPLAHVEAGLRSFDMRMPEEVNRIVCDRLSRLLFCPSETAVANLAAEGIVRGVELVGDVMVDLARMLGPIASERSAVSRRARARARLLRARDRPPPGQHGAARARPARRGPAAGRGPRRAAAASAHARGARRCGLARRDRAPPARAAPARIPRLHGPAAGGARVPDRLGRRPEGGLPPLASRA